MDINRDQIKEALKAHIMRDIYDPWKDERFNRKIEEALGVTPKEMMGNMSQAALLVGLPGDGKSTLMREAAQEVCQTLGLNFVQSLQHGKKPTPDDLVFYVDMGQDIGSFVADGSYLKERKELVKDLREAGAALVVFDGAGEVANQRRIMEFMDSSKLEGVLLPALSIAITHTSPRASTINIMPVLLNRTTVMVTSAPALTNDDVPPIVMVPTPPSQLPFSLQERISMVRVACSDSPDAGASPKP